MAFQFVEAIHWLWEYLFELAWKSSKGVQVGENKREREWEREQRRIEEGWDTSRKGNREKAEVISASKLHILTEGEEKVGEWKQSLAGEGRGVERRIHPTSRIRWGGVTSRLESLYILNDQELRRTLSSHGGEPGPPPLPISSVSVWVVRTTYLHADTMGTVSELCVSSLQTFLCPAVKALQEAPGKVTTVGL